MKSIPNHILDSLIRYIPTLIACIDPQKIRHNARLGNIIRIVQRQILPKLIKTKRSDE